MAGEWLKFDCTLPEKPETLALTVAMGWDDPDLTVGKLMRLFRWFDQHTIDGNARGVTPVLLDRLLGVTGFVQAVANVGWLTINDTGLILKNFDKHNGSTAKSRVLTAIRVANHRLVNSNDPNVTSALARVEKSREEKNNTIASNDEGFAAFWKAYPKKIGKAQAEKAWRKLGHVNGLLPAILKAVESQAASDPWRKDGGAFIPHPATWINGRRWEDEIGPNASDKHGYIAGQGHVRVVL